VGTDVGEGSTLRDTLYIEELIGSETDLDHPEETIRVFQDHGRVRLRLESDVDEATYLLNQLDAVGLSYDDVVRTLECEGVERFATSSSELLKQVAEKRSRFKAGARSRVPEAGRAVTGHETGISHAPAKPRVAKLFAAPRR
jgi:transaldolase/fructose-6-phosphate aldolase-like protein